MTLLTMEGIRKQRNSLLWELKWTFTVCDTVMLSAARYTHCTNSILHYNLFIKQFIHTVLHIFQLEDLQLHHI